MNVEQLDRRSFLAKTAVSGLALAAGTDLTGCEAVARNAAHHAARRAARRTSPPIPRSLSQAIRGQVFDRTTPAFAGAARVYNTHYDHVLPRWVARPIDSADVAAAVRWAVARRVPMRARSGGHSYAGYSTLADGLVVDLRRLDHIAVERRTGTASIGAGAQLINVYAALASHGATIPAGTCPSVGIAGHALGGGMGLAGRAFGLTLDNLVEIEIVTADGQVRSVSRRREPELFWGLRGAGGGNFGIVTQFRFRVHPLPRVASWVFMSWPWAEAGTALETWQAWQPQATERFSSIFHLETGAGGPVVGLGGQYLGPASELPSLLSSLRSVPGSALSYGEEGYPALQMRWAGCTQMSFQACDTVGTHPGASLRRANFRGGSDYVNRPLSDAGRATLAQVIESQQGQPSSAAILLDSYGGAINRVSRRATAFPHRDSLYCIQYLIYGGTAAWVEQARASMRPHTSGFCYSNYTDPTLSNWQHAYYGSNYGRLEAIRRRYDPAHHFNFPQAIGR